MWPTLPGPGGFVPTYYVIISLAFTLATLWVARRAEQRKLNITTVMDLALWIMVGAFVGGRLGHVIFEEPLMYIKNPLAIFKFWYGGFVFYGGFIGAVLGSLIFRKIKSYDYWVMADLIAPVLAFGYGLGRLGCFMAGCCYGKPTTLPWGIVFPSWSEAPAGIPLHPTQVYCTLWEWGVMALLLILEKRSSSRPAGFIFGIWLTLHGLGRGIIEQFRDDFRGQNVFNLSISTWISVVLVAGGLYLIFTKRNNHVSTSV